MSERNSGKRERSATRHAVACERVLRGCTRITPDDLDEMEAEEKRRGGWHTCFTCGSANVHCDGGRLFHGSRLDHEFIPRWRMIRLHSLDPLREKRLGNAVMSKFTVQAKTCIKGEAFFESLLAEYAIPHHIQGAKDLGADYLCQWSYSDEPSGVLFTAQVKSFKVKGRNKPKSLEHLTPTLNALQAYSINNSNLTIKQPTLDYWKGLGFPAYLFVVVHTGAGPDSPDEMAMYYKRFTPVLTGTSKQEDEHYYRVDKDGVRFRAFADEERRTQGFTRDLFIDFMRWSYSKGNIAWMNPRKLGLLQFPEEDAVFEEFIETYNKPLSETYAKTKKYLERYCR